MTTHPSLTDFESVSEEKGSFERVVTSHSSLFTVIPMTTLERLKQATALNITEYEKELVNAIKDNLTNQDFDAFDNYLLDLIRSNPVLVKEISLINLKLFKKTKNPFWIGYTYNTLVSSLLKTKSVHLILPYFKEGLVFCMKHDHLFQAGHSICTNVKNDAGVLKQDELIQLLKLSIDFYKKYNKNKLVIKNMSQAALIFSNVGAYQAAYRLLNDAEIFCNEKNLQQLHADVIATAATISMEEADFSFAEKTFKAAFSFYEVQHKTIPYRHLFNWGTLLIRIGRYREAEDVYKTLKSAYGKFKDPRIDLNLAVAYKNQQKYELAFATLEQIESRIDPADNSEWISELYIILSSTLALTHQYEDAATALNKSVMNIERYLSTIFRFHYRRGIRGKYYRRIVDIIEIVFPKIDPLKLLNVLVYLKTNSQSDWLSIIEWVEQINKNSSVVLEDKKRLNTKFNNLVNFGGVIVNSFKEKYDDPFEDPSIENEKPFIPPGNHLPWQELALITQEFTEKYSLHSHYELNSIKKLSTALAERIKESAILFVFIVKDKYLIYNISSDHNNVYEIESHAVIDHAKKLLAYRTPKTENAIGLTSAKDQFRLSLESLTLRLSYALNDLISFIVSRKVKNITIIPEVFDSSLPLFATFFSTNELAERFLSGDLTIETIPVLFKGNSGDEIIDSTSVITNEFNSLDLFAEEGKLLEKYFTPNYFPIIVDHSSRLDKWAGQLKQTKSVHIISHGSPISFYTDPSFSALDGEVLHLDSLQHIFLDSECLLFTLNACNSGDTVNSNFHTFFKSYEAVSFVSILLQNRKSKVIAAQWPELDTFSYVFTSIFYQKVKRTSDIRTSFAKTITEIKKSDKQYFLAIVNQIENESVRVQKEALISNASSSEPFDRVLMFGCLNLYGLL